MKPRNREINIFNMSLLDVLCGALGAFCFMMLVLFPYYKPAQQSNPPPTPPQNCEDCMKQHGQMREQMETLNQRNTQLEMRNPFTVEMVPRFPGYDLDLYIEDDRVADDGTKSAKPDVKVEQDRKFGGDRYLGGRGQYPELWMIRDAPKGAYRVYYKVMKFSGDPTILPILVEGRFVSDKAADYLPKVVVRKVGEIFHVATITSDGKGNFTMKPEMPDGDLQKVLNERGQLEQEEQRKQEEKKKQAPAEKKDEPKKQ